MKLVDIGALSKISGLPTSTLRYYEEVGLIHPICRNGLRRQYSEETIVQLALIGLGKAAGFSLEDIGGMFDKNRNADLPRPTLLQRADELDRQILRMTTMSRLLRHVAECPADSHMNCPRFRKLLRVVCPSMALTGMQPRGAAGGEE
ncbi:MerR family transcriptional regulator [Stutzerimonas zhaodongensis]|uniref:MerR family transcriptional regulator n=1 Tax=Stutzerimonas zhaodongensis TaxID=1176257 RepID=A0A3M2HL97_9GAMM|nr:helix-turn-helix domain-containing protein [Stutzerimonas zhaodongensis]MCQ4317782.1 helix-turn-helix domain-containing protein [Stutzerimonas zhaodongensis]RMH87702.1 MerR family transcriptional regulator [Stutzerimonas zhaodongensis]